MSATQTNAKERVLLIEDEESIRVPLIDLLEDEGYEVLAAEDGERGLELALQEDPQLILLDLMLPRLDGFGVLRALRRDRLEAPVIVLSARGEEWDRIQGFEHGADDYVVKPFNERELLLRMRALLKRSGGRAPGVQDVPDCARIGAATIDFAGYCVERDGVRLPLVRLELELLRYFLAHEGEVLSRERLLNDVWAEGSYPTTRTVDTHMLKLRKKVEADPERPVHLLTVRGVGYKFQA